MDTEDLLGRPYPEGIAWDEALRQRRRAQLLGKLLDQHDHYDLGDGWSVGRNLHHWNIYYRGKHVDAWRGESVGLSIREQINSDLKSYATAAEAIEVARRDMTNGFFETIASE